MLEAYTHLKYTTHKPPLVMIGYPAADEPTHFPPGVVVLRDFPHKAVMAAWRRALFGVLPSKWAEPLGSAVHEGMSQGKAVIGTFPGGHTDMIEDGVSGFLVPSGDVKQLGVAMQTLLDNEALRESMGKAAAERAELFTAKHSVPQFEQAYRETIALAAQPSKGTVPLVPFVTGKHSL